MTSTSFLMILIGIFVIINAANFVGVLKGEKRFGATPTKKAEGDTTVRSTSTVSEGGDSGGHSIGSTY